MNEQPRKPGEERTFWRHENARVQLELLGLKFLQPSGRGGKLYFRMRDLEEVAPQLAALFGASAADPEDDPRDLAVPLS